MAIYFRVNTFYRDSLYMQYTGDNVSKIIWSDVISRDWMCLDNVGT